MAMTAPDRNLVEPPEGCWCCGDRTAGASLVRLHAHPEVGVCFRCIQWLDEQRDAIGRRTGQVRSGPWWRQLQDRAAAAYDQFRKRPGGTS
jgi:hypothetical protein